LEAQQRIVAVDQAESLQRDQVVELVDQSILVVVDQHTAVVGDKLRIVGAVEVPRVVVGQQDPMSLILLQKVKSEAG